MTPRGRERGQGLADLVAKAGRFKITDRDGRRTLREDNRPVFLHLPPERPCRACGATTSLCRWPSARKARAFTPSAFLLEHGRAINGLCPACAVEVLAAAAAETAP